jgi:hypothetical protein
MADRWPTSDAQRRRDRIQQLYAQQLGDERADEQAELAKQLHACCGENRDGPHHEACAKWVEPAPTVHPNQETLI